MPKLKVYRTAAEFHDAYVAAPSRKAALAAWRTDKDLFARGVAEEVTDAALTRAPLAKPGEVIRVSRGGTSEQLAALGKADRRAKLEKPVPEPASPLEKTPAAPAAPEPRRAR